MVTHEEYIAAIVAIATSRLEAADQAAVSGIKIAYGAGPAGTRGVTYYHRWQAACPAGCDHTNHEPRPFVEICAFGQESHWQVAGTVLHELGHVLAGFGAGHGKGWKDACARLGLRRIQAAGTRYLPSMFEGPLRLAIAALPRPTEGQPVTRLGVGAGAAPIVPKPCGAGVGTRGGKSRGVGSGSRLRLWECECAPRPVKVRVASDDFDATCNRCGAAFHRA